MARTLISIVLLTMIYVLTLGNFALWDLVAGAVFATLLLLAGGKELFSADQTGPPNLLRRMVAFVPFSLAFIGNTISGTWETGLVSVRLRPLPPSGIIAVPIGERTPLGVAVSSFTISLSPGSVLIDVDAERRMMLFHVLDASDPDAIRAHYQRFYDRFQRHVFP